MKKITCLFLVFISLSFVNVAYSQSSKEEIKVSTNSSSFVQTEIDYLRNQMEVIRQENYSHAIKSAEDAGLKADRLLNWIVGIATIFGVIIALVALIVGGDLAAKLKELRVYVKAAKKNANLIETIAKEAEEKGKQLTSEIKELQNIKKELDDSKGKSKEQEVKINQLINKAQGTISEIQSLSNSASFISGATIPYPSYSTVNVSEPITVGSIMGMNNSKICKKCFSLFTPGQTLLSSLTGNQDFCSKCELRKPE